MDIKSIINKENHTIKVNDSIDVALEIMDKFHINGMPVMDDKDNLVGMVVKADIYRFMISPGHYETCPIEWVMSKSVILAKAEEDVVSTAKRLRENNIVSMPVLENNKIIGTITLENCLDYFLK
jgi:predicted transcriptional regulator